MLIRLSIVHGPREVRGGAPGLACVGRPASHAQLRVRVPQVACRAAFTRQVGLGCYRIAARGRKAADASRCEWQKLGRSTRWAPPAPAAAMLQATVAEVTTTRINPAAIPACLKPVGPH